MFGAIPPALPWEVIERVIGHSAGRIRTLYSFALTCRQLNPRSTILLLRHVRLKHRGQSFELCDILRVKPHLQPCVQSVSIPLNEFSPHPLLRMLPKLSELKFDQSWEDDPPFYGLHLNLSLLRCCHARLGQHIQSLSLWNISFRSLSDFSVVLLLFPKIRTLSCTGVDTTGSGHVVHQADLTTRLSKRLQLRSLTIGEENSEMVLTLLVEAVKQRLVTLAYTTRNDASTSKLVDKSLMASTSDWVQLTSLTWKMDLLATSLDEFKSNFRRIVVVLKDFHPMNLREVTVVLDYGSLGDLVLAALPSTTELCAELEQTLIMFLTPIISFSPGLQRSQGMNGRRYHSWVRILGRFFPVLAERGALRIDAESWYAGHNDWIRTPIITSMDGRRAATASNDGTIIIWDLESRCISREWFVEGSAVDFLAFSPDRRYILSVSRDITGRSWDATIWDLSHEIGACKVRSLIGQGGDLDPDSNDNICCAWSPDGSWIAAGPQGNSGVTYIWETSTFEDLYSHAAWTWKGGLLAISPDGHWVITTIQGIGRWNDCWIWSIKSGRLHQTLADHTDWVKVAAFDQGSMHVVTGADDSTIRIWDIESGQLLKALENRGAGGIDSVAFSGDGGMVLSHSRPGPTSDESENEDDSAAGGVKVWDTSSGALLASLSQSHHDSREDSTPYPACFSPCGSYVASVLYGEEVLLWRISDWSCIVKVSGGASGAVVTHVAISPDGQVLCLGTEDGKVLFHRMHDLVSASQD